MSGQARCARTLGPALAILVAAAIGAAARADAPAAQDAGRSAWEILEPGLEFGTFEAPRRAAAGDALIRILRIDPQRFIFRLMNASAPDQGRRLTAADWCRRNGLVAATNASMYQEDLRTSVSLMRTRDHVNNPRLSRDRALFAFDPLTAGLTPAVIIDRDCDDLEALGPAYGTVIQSIRMISCTGRNVWAQQARRFSIAALGTDHAGRVLFIHARSLYSVHDLIDHLLSLPIGIARAMYGEGGSEAQLFIESGGRSIELTGTHESTILDDDGHGNAWPIPNALGIVRRQPKKVDAGAGEAN